MPPARSINTCTQCRARKVRCLGGPDACSNCERLHFRCSFVAANEPSVTGASSEARIADAEPPTKRRRPKACLACRASKSRCSGELPACANCLERGKSCVYPDRKRHADVNETQKQPPGPMQPPENVMASQNLSPSTTAHSGVTSSAEVVDALHGSHRSSTGPASWNHQNVARIPNDDRVIEFVTKAVPASQPLAEGSLPPAWEQLQLIGDFFRHLHPDPATSFLNEVSITQRCLDGSLDPCLLRALCAMSAMSFKYAKYHPVHTAAWVRDAENDVWQAIERPTIFKTQALLLIVLYYSETGRFQRAFMLVAIVFRFAGALRLHYERIDLGHLSQEIRRRLMWCIVLANDSFSGLPESDTRASHLTHLKYPCPEEAFHSDHASLHDQRHIQTDNSAIATGQENLEEGGILELYLRHAIIRREVMKVVRQMATAQVHDSSTVFLEKFQGLIDQLEAARPNPYNIERLHSYKRSRWLVRYVLYQMSWHQCHCDLYRMFLAGYREAAPDPIIATCPPNYIHKASTICLEHAHSILNILFDVDDLRIDMIVAPKDMFICPYHACRLLLFLSRSGSLPPAQTITPDEASALAVRTLTILRRIVQNSSGLTRKIVEDLNHVITTHAQGTPGQPRDSSEEDDDGARPPRPRYARAFQRQRQKTLGVHSALRYARFEDQDQDGPEAQQSARNPIRTDSDAPQSTLERTPQDPVSGNISNSTWMAPPPTSMGDSTWHAAMLLNLAQPHQQHLTDWVLDTEPLPMGAYGAWDSWQWPENFVPGAEGDFV